MLLVALALWRRFFDGKPGRGPVTRGAGAQAHVLNKKESDSGAGLGASPGEQEVESERAGERSEKGSELRRRAPRSAPKAEGQDGGLGETGLAVDGSSAAGKKSSAAMSADAEGLPRSAVGTVGTAGGEAYAGQGGDEAGGVQAGDADRMRELQESSQFYKRVYESTEKQLAQVLAECVPTAAAGAAGGSGTTPRHAAPASGPPPPPPPPPPLPSAAGAEGRSGKISLAVLNNGKGSTPEKDEGGREGVGVGGLLEDRGGRVTGPKALSMSWGPSQAKSSLDSLQTHGWSLDAGLNEPGDGEAASGKDKGRQAEDAAGDSGPSCTTTSHAPVEVPRGDICLPGLDASLLFAGAVRACSCPATRNSEAPSTSPEARI